MEARRTGGMTAVGILSIVFGTIGALFGLLMVIGGGWATAAGPALAAEMDANGEDVAGMAAAMGGVMMVMGLVGLVSSATLGVSGIGVLMLKPWGRVLSIVCGIVIVLLNLFMMATAGPGLFTGGFTVYGMCLVGLFFRPEWKAAFGGARAAGTAAAPHESDHQRWAA